jgi:hypothetical protein
MPRSKPWLVFRAAETFDVKGRGEGGGLRATATDLAGQADQCTELEPCSYNSALCACNHTQTCDGLSHKTIKSQMNAW